MGELPQHEPDAADISRGLEVHFSLANKGETRPLACSGLIPKMTIRCWFPPESSGGNKTNGKEPKNRNKKQPVHDQLIN